MTDSMVDASPPKPMMFYKWFALSCFMFLWSIPALLGIPRMGLDRFSLIASETMWLVLCSWLTLLGQSWFRVRLSAEGVTRKGIFRTVHISWTDATLTREGFIFVVSSTNSSIKLNPFIYRDPSALELFLSRRLLK
jgi:hypothetical protein